MRLLYVFLLLLAAAGARAQITVNSIQASPARPTATTPIKVAVTVTSSTLGRLINSQWQRTGDTLYINNCYSRGISQLVVTYTDTVSVGSLPAGQYTVKVSAKAAYLPTDCQGSAVISKQLKSLAVSSTLAATPAYTATGWTLYPQPAASRHLHLTRPDAVAVQSAVLLDATGRPCFSSSATPAATSLDLSLPPSLAAGSYVLRLYQASGSVSSLRVLLP